MYVLSIFLLVFMRGVSRGITGFIVPYYGNVY